MNIVVLCQVNCPITGSKQKSKKNKGHTVEKVKCRHVVHFRLRATLGFALQWAQAQHWNSRRHHPGCFHCHHGFRLHFFGRWVFQFDKFHHQLSALLYAAIGIGTPVQRDILSLHRRQNPLKSSDGEQIFPDPGIERWLRCQPTKFGHHLSAPHFCLLGWLAQVLFELHRRPSCGTGCQLHRQQGNHPRRRVVAEFDLAVRATDEGIVQDVAQSHSGVLLQCLHSLGSNGLVHANPPANRRLLSCKVCTINLEWKCGS